MAEPATEKPQADPTSNPVTTWVSCLLLAVYVVLLVLQWTAVDGDETEWIRRQALLVPLEALAFAAAGALLGTTVQRQVTKKAESQAEDAERRAASNVRDAEKGRALQHAINARVAHGVATQDTGITRGGPSAADPFAELAELARRYDGP